MKAIVYAEYGPPEVLRLKEIEKPVPKDNEILIKIHATPIGYGDILARNFRAVSPKNFNMPLLFLFFAKLDFGFRKPKKKILGSEFAGVIESVGKKVTLFKAGNEVFGYRGAAFGANAEYLCMTENSCVAIKPTNLNFEEAASVPYGAITAFNLLKQAKLQKGQKVLINGASGGIGSAAVQLAKNHFGAEVTGVCSTPRVELVKSLGADRVIDYTLEDFTHEGETYDLIFDILGKSTFKRCKKSLNKNGCYLLASFKLKQILQMLTTKIAGNKRVICALSIEKTSDLIFVKELIEAGKIKAVIDKRFPLEQTAQAHHYVENGQKKGSVVISIN